jgi:hypothetical protein
VGSAEGARRRSEKGQNRDYLGGSTTVEDSYPKKSMHSLPTPLPPFSPVLGNFIVALSRTRASLPALRHPSRVTQVPVQV